MSNLKKILAKNLRRLRHERNLNQDDMAEVLEISLGAYQNYELEKNLPKPEKMKALATFFDVSVSDLLENEEGEKFKLSEKVSVGELLNLFQRKFAGIPDDVIELSMNFSKDDKEVWDVVRGALEHGLKNQAKHSRKAKKSS